MSGQTAAASSAARLGLVGLSPAQVVDRIAAVRAKLVVLQADVAQVIQALPSQESDEVGYVAVDLRIQLGAVDVNLRESIDYLLLDEDQAMAFWVQP